jgi:hypothetical protein
MNRLRNITRRDQESNRTHAWLVTLQRRNTIVNRMFTDAVYGGKRKALKAAIEYRDAMIQKESPYQHEMWVRTRIRKNNRSGIVGVARYERPANLTTGHRPGFWVASWVDENGASRKRKFAVSIHGERQAKRLAVAERDRQLKRVCEIKAQRT